jgi:hypothetical protein
MPQDKDSSASSDATSLTHFHHWMEQQRVYLNAKEKFSQRDAEILSHAYVRNFPNRLHVILAELTMEKQRGV